MRVIGSRRAFAGRLLTVRIDEIENPSGLRWSSEVVEHPGAVAVVAVQPDRQIVLVRQTRPAVGRMLLELPAGTLEAGESPEACARRELIEEAGYAAERWERLTTFYPSPGFLTEHLHLFLAQDLRPASADREEEDLTVYVMPLAEARRRVDAGEICDSKSIIGVLLACERFDCAEADGRASGPTA